MKTIAFVIELGNAFVTRGRRAISVELLLIKWNPHWKHIANNARTGGFRSVSSILDLAKISLRFALYLIAFFMVVYWSRLADVIRDFSVKLMHLMGFDRKYKALEITHGIET